MTGTGGFAGYRLLQVSVRGHCYLVGGPTIHPAGIVPPGVGTRFMSLAAIQRYVSCELRGITAIWQVRVIDDTATVLWLGLRAGYNATGGTWTWRPPTPPDNCAVEADQ